jgi:two-component system response regulator DesR
VGDVAKAMSAIRALRPDVALLAAVFPADRRVANWIDVAAAARAVAPHCRCAILSSAWRSPDLEGAVAAGVRGFLMGDSPAEHLIAAVRRLAAGQQVVDSRLSLTRRSPLTHRELDVLRVASQGSTTAEIAAALCLSEGTVRNYLSRAIAKTGARNRLGAFKVAADSGWL